MGAIRKREITIEARDGHPLAATRFEPGEPADGPSTVLAPAMGVPRGFYDDFARFLAERGHRVLSFDYRGVGGSAARAPRRSAADLFAWGRLDLASGIDAACEAAPDGRVRLAGHSVAGQILGLAPNNTAVSRALLVGSTKGYWRLWRGRQALAIWTLSHVLVPALSRLLGYLPARLVGLGGEDLPAGVALDWARWIRHEDYVVDRAGNHPREGYERVQAAIRGLSLADDWYAPPAGVEALLAMYPSAATEHVHVAPSSVGLGGIGHFGFFRPRCRRLWVDAADWLGEKDAVAEDH